MTAVEYLAICENDYGIFHDLLDAYYRDGEDENTPQEEMDSFIRFLFEKVIAHEIHGVFAKRENIYIGFGLWAVDTEEFEFSEMPGCGTIMEIGFIPRFRASGFGRSLVMYMEGCMRSRQVNQCYVSAYGPAQAFWERCGYVRNGKTAGNGLQIMVKKIH